MLLANYQQLIVIASIHQPSTKTFDLFSKVTLLSQGKTCYTGPVPEMSDFFADIGMPIPGNINPAEHVLDLVNADFSVDSAQTPLDTVFRGLQDSPRARQLCEEMKGLKSNRRLQISGTGKKPSFFAQVVVLLHRAFIKSFRDIVAYWIRVAMYMGLAIMMGTVWLRLSSEQKNIQPIVNAIVSAHAIDMASHR